MKRPRIIPILLLRDRRLVKGTRFENETYVGDPINAVKIFNEKEVDEIVLLDIDATVTGRSPDLRFIEEIASEAFVPLCYGGGVTSTQAMRDIFYAGVEKIAINHAAVHMPSLIEEASSLFGRQSIIVSIDVRRDFLGRRRVFTDRSREKTSFDPIEFAQKVEALGAGELLLTSIDREGTLSGYDLDLVKEVSRAVDIPVIASGGAGTLAHMAEALKAGASAAGAGTMFVFHGPHRAVLITFPSPSDISEKVGPIEGSR